MKENGNVYANSKYKIFNDLGLGDVRTYVDEQGVVWFFMNDIARILDIKNPRDIVANLHNSGLSAYVGISDGGKIHSNQYGVSGVIQNVKETTIKESALLYICGRSRKPNAQKLFRFVSEKVVPNLARYGGYIMPEDREIYNSNPDLVKDLIENNKKLEDQLQVSYEIYKEQEDNYNELVQDYNSLIEENDELRKRLEELEDEDDEDSSEY